MAQGKKGSGGQRCNVCGTTENLLPDPNNTGGYKSRCAGCNAEQSAQWRERKKAERLGMPAPIQEPPAFDVPALPDDVAPVEELRERRCREWTRTKTAHDARKIIPVHVFTEGPIGLAVFGDLHIDDPGTNFPLIERCTDLVRTTEGMFACAVGDLQNAWIGRLARLWASQSLSAQEAWRLVEWWVRSLDGRLLFINNGNHDLWSHNVNGIDPLEWIKGQQTIVGKYGVRIQLCLPGGQTFNVNCRHDFQGRSEVNPAFGVTKATRFAGHVDDVALAGHIHTFGYNPIRNPVFGKVCHPMRVASFKTIDDYAMEGGFPDSNVTECPVIIFDTTCPDARHVVHIDFNPERGARMLTMLRREWATKQAKSKDSSGKRRAA